MVYYTIPGRQSSSQVQIHPIFEQHTILSLSLVIYYDFFTYKRMFEERKNLLITMTKEKKGIGSKSALERAQLSQVHIDRIRRMLKSANKKKI